MKESQSLKKCERELSIKERKTIQGIFEGKPVSKSMVDAGYAETTAHGKCSEKYKELEPTIKAIMESKGLTDDKLIQILKDGLRADKEGSKGNLLADYGTRHRYLETALKLKELLGDKADVNVNIDLAERLREARMRARIEAGSRLEDR
jgi:hypothetical protein